VSVGVAECPLFGRREYLHPGIFFIIIERKRFDGANVTTSVRLNVGLDQRNFERRQHYVYAIFRSSIGGFGSGGFGGVW